MQHTEHEIIPATNQSLGQCLARVGVPSLRDETLDICGQISKLIKNTKQADLRS